MGLKKAAIYMRVSTDRQAKEGDSIAAQRDALRKYVDAREDMILAGEYIDDGISGRKFEERDELQRLLADVRKKDIDVILFTKLDRWYRSIRHYTATQDVLDKYGVTWCAIWEPIYDTTTPAGRLIVNQMMSIAQFEAENTGQRIRQVMAYKAQKGEALSGNTPIGYRIEGKRLVPDGQAAAARDIFEHFAFSGNLADTCRHAMEEHGICIGLSTLKYMLRNTKYIGLHRGNPSYCEPIIKKSTFDDVQRKLRINIKAFPRPERAYIFSGLAVCGVCGTRLSASYSKGKRYRCRRHVGVRTCQNSTTIAETILEKYLLDNVRAEAARVIAEAETEEPPVRDTRKQIAAINGKITRLKDLYVNDLISLDEYKHDREQLISQLQELEAYEPPAAKDYTALQTFLASGWEKAYADLTDEEKRFLWRSVIDKITITDREHIRITFLA